MPFSLALRSLRPRLIVAVAAGFLACGAPSAQAALPAGWRFAVQIEDNVALPGQQGADAVYGGYASDAPFPGAQPSPDGRDALTVERGGKTIAGVFDGTFAYGLDLQPGDEFVYRRTDAPDRPEVARFTYRGLPRLDGPVCAGASSYAGTLDPSATDFIVAQGVLWRPASEFPPVPKPPFDGYPPGPYLPWSFYPGEYPGFGASENIRIDAELDGPGRFKLTPPRPLLAGTHIYVRGGFRTPLFAGTLRVDQVVQDCPGPSPTPVPLAPPTPTPTPSPTPTSTPAPQTQPVPGPAGDRTPPKITFTGPTTASLRKIGRAKLLRGGLPVKVVSDEPARIVGTLTFLGGKRPFVSSVDQPVIKGTTITELVFSRTMRRLVTTTRNARLRLEAAIVDAAGNRTPLPTITVKVPRR